MPSRFRGGYRATIKVRGRQITGGVFRTKRAALDREAELRREHATAHPSTITVEEFVCEVEHRARVAIGKTTQVSQWTLDRAEADSWARVRVAELMDSSRRRLQPTVSTEKRFAPRGKFLYDLRSGTRATYRSDIVNRIIPDLGGLRVARVTPAQLRDAVDGWRASYSDSTANSAINCLVRVFRRAKEEGIRSDDPTAGLTRRDDAPPRTTPSLRRQDVVELASRCAAVRPIYGHWVLVAAYTGARARELESLRVGDVDMERRRIHIRRGADDRRTKSRKERTVIIADPLLEVLKQLIPAGAPPSRPLFASPTASYPGGRIRHANFRTAVRWKEMVAELGHNGLFFHDLRATAIMEWTRMGIPITVIRTMVGHASLATTQRYARLALDDLDLALDRANQHYCVASEGVSAGGINDSRSSDREEVKASRETASD